MNIIPLFVALPLAVAFIIPMLSRKFKWFPDIAGNITTLILAGMSFSVIGKTGIYSMGAWEAPIGIVMVLDGLSVLLLIAVNVIAFASTLFSVNYMDRYTSKLRYYSLFLLMVAGMNGVVLSGDLFNLYVFLEIASVASYALVGFGCEHEEIEASFKYLVLGTVASAFILLGIGITYGSIGSLNMAQVSEQISLSGMNNALLFAVALFIMGFGLKAALVPFHAWLPDAHPSAPAPISSMLSGVLIKALGIYTLARILFNVIGVTDTILNILMVLGAVSMVIGVLLALGQWDFKRLLAYHSISQVGYIILGIGLGTPLGILGGLFHLINHSVFKSLLFLNAGAIEYSTGTRQLDELGGMKEKMPVTGGTSLVASMSIAGIPPFNGFWSKLIIIAACIQAGRPVFAALAVFASILTLASFLKVQKYAFFDKLKDKWKDIEEVPVLMRLSMVLLALLCIVMCVLLLPLLNTGLFDNIDILGPAVDALMKGTAYAVRVLG